MHASSFSPLFRTGPSLKLSLLSSLIVGGALALSGICYGAPAGFSESDLVVVSKPSFPKVSYALKVEKKALVIGFSVARFLEAGDAEPISVRAGVANGGKSVVLEGTDFKRRKAAEGEEFVASIPLNQLGGKEDLGELRFAFSVDWGKEPYFRDNYFHERGRSRHAGLSEAAKDWKRIDLAEVTRSAAERRAEIAIPFQQPLDGKATIVIEDESGKRIRNLTSALPLGRGSHRLVWDGADDNGTVVPPGNYRWRGISHPGLKESYLFRFGNGPGSNHGTICSAATNGKNLYFGTPVSEGGHQIVELDAEGNFLRGFNPPHGHGLSDVALAVDDDVIYALYDGMGWGDKVDRKKPNWSAENRITLCKISISDWATIDFPGKERHVKLAEYPVGPGSTSQRGEKDTGLAGVALYRGKLYVGDRVANELLVVSPETGAVEKRFPLKSPRALATDGEALFAVAGGKLLRVDVASGATTELATVPEEIGGLAMGKEGRFYLADRSNSTLLVLSKEGKEVRRIGTPGGVKAGPYDPYAFHRPRGMVTLNGNLWVTEEHRWMPKRFAAFSEETGNFVREHIGPAAYGSPGAGFDEEDHEFWIALQTTFNVDFKAQTAKPLSITGGKDGRRHRIWRQDGRTFVITSGKATYVQELTREGILKPLAFISSSNQYSVSVQHMPPEGFKQAYLEAAPTAQFKEWMSDGKPRYTPTEKVGVVWVDKNGDGEYQKEEFDITAKTSSFAGAGWSHDFHDLTFRVPAVVDGKGVLVEMKPQGYYPSGAPKYPSLEESLAKAVPIAVTQSGPESAVDRFGNIILNSTPAMMAFDPTGKTLWSYPNLWTNVHGSHKAPLPERGQLQGVLFFSGVAPLDEKSDVFLVNGNHGQAFVMTSDGLFLDSLFTDVRLLVNPQGGGIGILGGECFGGTFGRSKKNGKYYFQGGGLEYRIYEVEGLTQTVRTEGTVTVSAEQSSAAEAILSRKVSEAAKALTAKIERVLKPIKLDGNPSKEEWGGNRGVEWRGGPTFDVKTKAAVDDDFLYLSYEVRDASPWVNNGKDWQSLFKTGDGVDLQIALDPSAKPNRQAAAPGDIRLFIAPFEGDSVAVLYRHRVPGADEKESVQFQSPWRSEKVDVVKRLANAKIAVRKEEGRYSIEAQIPLEDLGMKGLEGKKLKGDFGVIYGDPEGTINVYRNYWSNKATGLVNDVPGEIMLTPSAWSEIEIGGKRESTEK